MPADPLAAETFALLPHEWGAPEMGSVRTLDDVRAFVAHHIARLLDRNPALLMSILYRIDVDERQVQHAIQTSPPGALADDLATLVVERQLQKVHLRRKYRAKS